MPDPAHRAGPVPGAGGGDGIPADPPEARGGEQDPYDALCAYTLQRGDAEFIHQHVVDAHAAQRADESTRPMTLAFALLGLYLGSSVAPALVSRLSSETRST